MTQTDGQGRTLALGAQPCSEDIVVVADVVGVSDELAVELLADGSVLSGLGAHGTLLTCTDLGQLLTLRLLPLLLQAQYCTDKY